jgi:hypothetical protein
MRLIPATLLLALMVPAVAQEHRHPPQHADIHDHFYSTWERPDMPGVSCCDKKDCAPAEARFKDGVWHARQVGTSEWLTVPASKIEQRRDSPDGRSHLCNIRDHVICFIHGSGT